MLPATARKKLKIPHHLAIVSAGLCLLTALIVDLQPPTVDAETSLAGKNSVLDGVQTPAAKDENKSTKMALQLPRLFPWAPHRPTGQ